MNAGGSIAKQGNDMNLSAELQVAIEAVKKAATVCMAIRKSNVCEDAISKKDHSPVTIADFGSQAVIIRELLAAFPDARIVAEEDSQQMAALQDTDLGAIMVNAVKAVIPEADWESISNWVSKGDDEGGANGRFWTIDPIDGTKGFLRNEQYAVALALVENGEPVLGVLGCPNYPIDTFENPETGVGMLFFAAKGMGAKQVHLNLTSLKDALRISVSAIRNISEARLCESVESGHSSHNESERISKQLGLSLPPLRMDSQCKYAAVAKGDASIYLRLPTSESYREKIWDHAAGYLINMESGGIVTDIHGEKLDFSQGRTLANNQGIVASPATIHPQVLDVLKK